MNEVFKSILRILPDEMYIKLKYFYHFKKTPNLKHPRSFNEKLQWLKLHDQNPNYIDMVDKYEAKKYIRDLVGEEYIIPDYGVWNCFDDIDFSILPDKFVLKTTHDCGGIVICKDKNLFDKSQAKDFLQKHLNYNYFYEGREWQYKNIKPRIMAEKYMEDLISNALWDYKIFTFNGEAKIMFVATDRQLSNQETKFDFFDMEFERLDIRNGHPNSDQIIEKPKNFEIMKKIAEKLSEGIPHLRVDFYEVNGKLYVGELTFFHYSGMIPFEPEKWDLILGEWIKLP